MRESLVKISPNRIDKTSISFSGNNKVVHGNYIKKLSFNITISDLLGLKEPLNGLINIFKKD